MRLVFKFLEVPMILFVIKHNREKYTFCVIKLKSLEHLGKFTELDLTKGCGWFLNF
jgi:adenylate cyclase class IV